MSGTILNVFRNDAFSSVQLTDGVERNPYNPVGLGEMKLFDPFPIRTKAAAIEQRAGKLIVVPTSNRGDPLTERTTEKRQARYFECPRIAHGDTIRADEVQDVREFGTESVMMQLQKEVARRLSGPTGLLASVEFTKERMRLGAIQGLVRDADDTVLFNWYQEFGITPQPEVAFNLLAQTVGSLRPLCNQIVRTIARASQGAFTPKSKVMALCGDAFWDALTNHTDVRTTYLNWAAAEELRKGNAFEAMRFGGIDWFNYRGSDDASTIAVATNGARFFPADAPGIFQEINAPAEFVPWVNTLGKPQYVIPVFDRDRGAWWRSEVYSYPLFICTRPETLMVGTMDATADLPNGLPLEPEANAVRFKAVFLGAVSDGPFFGSIRNVRIIIHRCRCAKSAGAVRHPLCSSWFADGCTAPAHRKGDGVCGQHALGHGRSISDTKRASVCRCAWLLICREIRLRPRLMINFDALVLGPCVAAFGVPVTYMPLRAAQLTLSGIFNRFSVHDQLDAAAGVFVTVRKATLMLRLSDMNGIDPCQGDQVVVDNLTWVVADPPEKDGFGQVFLRLMKVQG
ncbi:MAG: major capsid protein [Acidocella sp.]|nr:major capsid protein [Acidocella sp.]